MRLRRGAWTAIGCALLQALVRGQDGAGADEPMVVRELLHAQDRGTLAAGQLAAALAAGGAAQAAAVAIVRHAMPAVSREMLTAIAAEPAALEALLREFAIAPRPALDGFVAAIAKDAAQPLAHRLYAVAARRTPPDRGEAELALRALHAPQEGTADARDAATLVFLALPSPLADQLVGKVHAAMLGGAPPACFLPWFERLSPVGCRQLLGLLASLPFEHASLLGDLLAARDDSGYWERVRAALDGEIQLEEVWLIRAGRLLDSAARRSRVAAVLDDPAASPALRLRAFDALLEAGAYEPAMGRFALGEVDGSEDGDRLRRLLAKPPRVLPDALVLEALSRGGAFALAAVRSQVHGLKSPAAEQAMVELLGQGAGAAPRDPLRRAIVEALVQVGFDAAVRRALDSVRDDPEQLTLCYDLLGRRRDPIATAVLLAEQERRPEPALADALRLALAESGDLRQLAQLVAAAPQRSGSFVRRCRHAVPVLREEHALRLLDAVAGARDAVTQAELVLWAGRCETPGVQQRIERIWRRGGESEAREAALHVLMAGAMRSDLVQQWQRGELDGDPFGPLVPGEAVATARHPLGAEDLRLLQYVLFDEPRRDPERERAVAARFPDGRMGFPLVSAVAQRLRREPAALPAVLAPAAALLRDGETDGLSRQRFLLLWTALQAEPELRERAGRLLAALVLAIPDAAGTGSGVAEYYLAGAAAERGDYAQAAAAAQRAVRLLLCDPMQRMHVRIHLGVRDPAAGSDPHAALAAAPALYEALAARARDDRAATAAAAARAAELAGRDAAALLQIETLLTWSRP